MKYRIKEKILWKKVDDEIVIVDTGKDSYSCLNSTGAEIWEMIDKGLTLREITRVLSERYDGDRAKIEKDADTLFKKLLSSGFLEKA
ncbi:MAG: PqqD family protein [Endomicrobiales bacterium]